ncbi:MAG TPA: MBL fold metallo-hydrolase [Tepidisphaeraceae bacterium]|jgi:metallo-beta-lactamase family protein|nr:MBL fold metallo-hydrolase [Tepidisphaeraceae bacterium]
MRIRFCGADRTVTGSCHLIEVNGLRLFLDMGMYQGAREEARRINQWLPAKAKSADALILSHGHLDHCGKIPVLTRAGFSAPIYCTPATAEVARIVLEDSAKIQEEDAGYLNQRSVSPGEAPIRPLYVASDVPVVLRQMRKVPYQQRTDLGRGVSFTFFDAGHILGSAYILLEWENNNPAEAGQKRKLLFTADVGRYNTPIIRDPQTVPGPVDYVITESTYGGRVHAPISEVGPQLLDAVKFAIAHRSRILVPAFAVGRTQTILWYLQRFMQSGDIPAIPVYVDSPMGVEVSEVTRRFRDNYDEQTQAAIGENDLFGSSRVVFARSVQESKKINSDNGPCVIIASSPTCEFGRILHHLSLSIERPNDLALFTGWTPLNTLGRRLQNGEKRVRIYDRWYDVRCQVRSIDGLSAHADSQELLKFLSPTLHKETQFYIVHGEPDQAEVFAERLVQNGAGRAMVPAMETSMLAESVASAKEVVPSSRTAATDE